MGKTPTRSHKTYVVSQTASIIHIMYCNSAKTFVSLIPISLKKGGNTVISGKLLGSVTLFVCNRE